MSAVPQLDPFEMVETTINDRYTLLLPRFRSELPILKLGWEVVRLESMRANLKPGMLVYDVGAEQGDLSALWALWGCDTVLIEPGPRVWPNIRAIWRANDLPPPRACFAGFAGAFDRDSEVGLNVHRWPRSADGPMTEDHGFCVVSERPDIPCIRLDTLAEQVGVPDAITMDVEGAELEVLKGANAILHGARPLLWISVHPTFMIHTFGQHVRDLWAFLRACDYEWRLIDYDHELHVFAWPLGPGTDGVGEKVVLPW